MTEATRWLAALALALPIVGLAALATGAAPRQQIINMNASEFVFAPDLLFAEPGERLGIQLNNIGQAPHDLVIELENGAKQQTARLMPGQAATLTFDAPATPGRYVYYCSVGQHRAQGMEGTLRVEEVAMPTPPAFAVLAEGLKNPHLLSLYGDALLVAEGGTGTPGQGFVAGNLDGQVTRLALSDPMARSVLILGLTNNVNPSGGVTGANHALWKDPESASPTAWVTLSGGTGHPEPKAQLLEVASDGQSTVLADFGDFERKNNPDGVPPEQNGLDSNPWKIAVGPGGQLYVTDAGANDVIKVDPATGALSAYAVFEPVGTRENGSAIQPVPTGLVFDPTQPAVAYVALLGSYSPGEAQVRRLEDRNGDGDALDEGENTLYEDGLTTAVDLAMRGDGLLFVLQLLPGTVSLVCQVCEPVPPLAGLAKPSGMVFDGQGNLYVSVAPPSAPPASLATDRVVKVPEDQVLPAHSRPPTRTPETPSPPPPTATATPTPTAVVHRCRCMVWLPVAYKRTAVR